MAQTNTNTENGNNKSKKPFYLNWKLWVAVSVGLILTTVGLVIAYGPVAIIVPVGVIATVVGGVSGPVIEAWAKVNEKLKDVKDKAERAEEKALIEGRRNSEIEKKADQAASTAVVLSDKVDVTAEGLSFLEHAYEALGRQYSGAVQMYEKLANELQEERAESKSVMAELRAQIDSLMKQNQGQQEEINRQRVNHQREITELKEQIRLMGVEKSSDKEKIIKLETQVKQLQDRVKELEIREGKLNDEKSRLLEENQELRQALTRGRRSTDNLNPANLPPQASE